MNRGSDVAEPVAALDVALSHALDLLTQHPALALEQAGEILNSVPGHPIATLIVGMAQRRLGDIPAALATLEPLARAQPGAGAVQYEYGLVLGTAGRGDEAIRSLRRAVDLNPSLPGAWLALADHLSASGDAQGAEAAYACHIRAATRDPRLLRPAAALCENDIPLAETLLRAHLREHPTDVAALRMLAEVAARLGRYADAEQLLGRCLELAPGFTEARAHYATVLNRQNRPLEALAQIERLLVSEPGNPNHHNLKASALVNIGEYQQAIDLYAGILAAYPGQSKVWLSYGHVLKTAGRQEECIRAYRRSLGLRADLGEAWWSLANLKTFRFTPADVAAMRAQLARPETTLEDRLHLNFALGKACEDARDYPASIGYYDEGNRLRRSQISYSAADMSAQLQRARTLFTTGFLAERAAAGAAAPDPIFIVGLPRAGSTLVDQILSSHSQVEGTMELYDLIALTRELDAQQPALPGAQYPEVLATLAPQRLRSLGEEYLRRARVQRKTDAPFFVDKMPNNFRHTGLILLTLPNAKIIDVRRHPLSSCFSAYKQHFARGQHFSYSLEDLGRYYRDYLELMAHFDRVAPGRVYRVHYEALIDNTEAEVRALLDYCQLPFEEPCLRFYENERAVRTASSEQVRQPIYRDALEQWRHFEPWLGPLKSALGPVLETYATRPAPQGAPANH
jgi:tetratricopeptide (TPR) repeat protein